jgi:hypothetical protein
MAVFDELQASRSHYVALLAVAEHPDLVTPALQFDGDAEHRRDVATTIPCDG